MKILALCIICVVAVCRIDLGEARNFNKYDPPCDVDVILMIDDSGSVPAALLDKMKGIAKKVIGMITSLGKIQVGVMEYGKDSELVIQLDEFNKKKQLREAISDRIPSGNIDDSQTRPYSVIEDDVMDYFALGGRAGARKVLVHLFDGDLVGETATLLDATAYLDSYDVDFKEVVVADQKAKYVARDISKFIASL